jgi:hypothetical protein
MTLSAPGTTASMVSKHSLIITTWKRDLGGLSRGWLWKAQATHFDQLPNQEDWSAYSNVPRTSQQGHAKRDFRRDSEQCADPGIPGLLHSGIAWNHKGRNEQRVQQRLDRQSPQEVYIGSQKLEGDPVTDTLAEPADQVDGSTQRDSACVPIHRDEFML